MIEKKKKNQSAFIDPSSLQDRILWGSSKQMPERSKPSLFKSRAVILLFTLLLPFGIHS